MKNLLITILALNVILSSCGDPSNSTENAKNNEGNKTQEKYRASKDNLSADEYMNWVNSDTLTPQWIVESLNFSNEYYQSLSAKAWIDTLTNHVLKIEENIVKKEYPSIKKSEYYFRNEKLLLAKEIEEIVVGDSLRYQERVTYYDSNEKAINSKYRIAAEENLLVEEEFITSGPTEVNAKRASNMLSLEGEFKTNFIDFLVSPDGNWLIVGDEDKAGFRTALFVTVMDPYLQEINKNKSRYIGMPMSIDFDIQFDNGMSFQRLLRASLIQ